MAELGDDALRGVELDSLFDKSVELVAQVLHNEYCKVLELLPGGDFVFLRAGVGWRQGLVRNAKVDTGLNSQAGYTLISNEPVIVKDLRTERRFDGPALLREHGVVSGMSVVIRGRSGPWGVLGTHTQRYHEFTTDDINFFQAVANILANAIERKRAEDDLQKLADNLEHRVELRTEELLKTKAELQEITRVVSHELQSPVRLLISHQALLAARYKDRLGEDADNFLAVMTSSAKKIERMIDDLWTYSRIDNPANHHPVQVDTQEVLAKVIQKLKSEISECAATITSQSLPVVLGIPSQIEYLFNEVIRNALTFRNAQKELNINVKSEPRDDHWGFVIEDNGIGFDMVEANKVFGMFQRLHHQTGEGTGMGLTICKRIVEFSGGNMWAQSEPGKGTRIYFTLQMG